MQDAAGDLIENDVGVVGVRDDAVAMLDNPLNLAQSV